MASCPSADTLSRFAAGEIADDALLEVEAHLDTCAQCRQAVAHLAALLAEDVAPDERLGSDGEDITVLLAAESRSELLGCYQELGQHARGGQGRILVAYDRIIGREVALKELVETASDTLGDAVESGDIEHAEPAPSAPPLSGDSVLARDRFQREARITAQLNHPTIVHIYELGIRANGRLYYTMPLVAGKTLAEAVRDCSDLEQRLRLLPHFGDVCQGVSYAHSRGIVHRDLKPQNVMVGDFGETILLDWGLAKVTQAAARDEHTAPPPAGDARSLAVALDSAETAQGTFAGTPGYASPEQVAGRSQNADVRTDVWGLGAILFEILTGRPPYPDASSGRKLRRSATEQPPAVTTLCDRTPPELVAIATKALQLDPEFRYSSAESLSADVSAYLEGRRVSAHEYHAWNLLKQYARRYRAVLAASAVIIAVTILALVLVSFAYHSESRARQREREAMVLEAKARKREHHQRLMASYQFALALAAEADRLAADRQYLAAGIYAAASLRSNPSYPGSSLYSATFASKRLNSADLVARSRSRIYQRRLSPLWRLRYSLRGRDALYQAVFSPDGRRVAVGTRNGFVRIIKADSGHLIRQWRAHTDTVNSLAFTPDGQTLLSASRDRTVGIWDARRFQLRHRMASYGDNVLCVVVSPDGQLAASASLDGTIRIWSAQSGSLRRVMKAEAGVTAVAFSPDGKRLASGGQDRVVTLWNSATGEVLRRLRGHKAIIYSLAFSPAGDWLASGGLDDAVRLWNPTTGQPGPTLISRASMPRLLQFSNDGRTLAVAGSGRRIDFWAIPSGRRSGSVLAHEEALHCVCYSPDGRQLASTGKDGRLLMWDVNQVRTRLPSLTGHRHKIYAVAYSPDGRWVASAGRGGDVLVWDVRRRRLHRRLLGHLGWIYQLTFAPGGKLLASASRDRTIRIWEPETGRLVKQLKGHTDMIYALAFRPDGRLLASGSHDKTVRLWEIPSGRLKRTLVGPQAAIYGVAFSPSGQLVGAASKDQTVRVWRTSTGQPIIRFRGHRDYAAGLVFLSESSVASSGKDRVILVWDVSTGRVRHRLVGHKQWVNRVALSPDRQLLASASDDRTVRIWNLTTGAPVLVLSADQEVTGIAFSPDGKWLAVGDDLLVRLYSLNLSGLAAHPDNAQRIAERAAGLRLEGFTLRVYP